ncbi:MULTISPECIES: DUF6194 family protein [unclassified Variovorax]|uniref:DUF6194 family protein n=1 Tax=unclassified Variovorax TaxID=663243 RepID=UPI003F481272
MTEDDITQYIIEMLGGGRFVVTDDNSFFFRGTHDKLPFAAIVTKDSGSDNASNLNRPGVFRLDVQVGEERFGLLFSEQAQAATALDALDRLMPHPVHAATHWVSVINPSQGTFETLKPLLAQARAFGPAHQADSH